jgi:hypothetical protein
VPRIEHIAIEVASSRSRSKRLARTSDRAAGPRDDKGTHARVDAMLRSSHDIGMQFSEKLARVPAGT